MECHNAFYLRIISPTEHDTSAEQVFQNIEDAAHFVLLEQFSLNLQANGSEMDCAMKERARRITRYEFMRYFLIYSERSSAIGNKSISTKDLYLDTELFFSTIFIIATK